MAKAKVAELVLDPTNIWDSIPPEEKFEMLAKAQARGVGAAIMLIIVGCTLAVGFRFDVLMWGALLVSPLLFQFVAGKAWRDMRPPMLLEYLAARSAARRYAFANKSQDLGLVLIFKGEFEPLAATAELEETFGKAFNAISGWIALFNDCAVVIAERPGGAECLFAQILNDKLGIAGRSESGEEYANDRELILTFQTKRGDPRRVKLTSRYPAALVVFEKKAQQLINAWKNRMKVEAPPADEEEPSLGWQE
jgi:hypothetical protein